MAYKNIICCIYKITSPAGKVYIGKTRNFYERMRDHKCTVRRRLTPVKYSILKYGWDSHKAEIVHQLPLDIEECVLDTYEVLYIEQYKSNRQKHPNGLGLNLTNGGDSNAGYVFTDADKKKISAASRMPGRNYSRGKSHKLYGVTGDKHPAFGHKKSEYAKMRITQTRSGGNHHMARKVINISTGEIFGTVKEAAIELGIKRTTLNAQLAGTNKNITQLRYLVTKKETTNA